MNLQDKRIAVLLSGGVDSSVVLYELVRQGLQPDCFYIKIGPEEEEEWDCSSEEDLEMATAVSHKYGCQLEVIDCHREYWDQVTKYTMDKVRAGLTPNPDVMCNRLGRGVPTGAYRASQLLPLGEAGRGSQMALHQSRPRQGPDRLPGTNLRLAAGEGALPYRSHDEGRGSRDCGTRTPGQCQAQGLTGHLFLRQNQL